MRDEAVSVGDRRRTVYLVQAQQIPLLGKVARQVSLVMGVDIPTSVRIGRDFRLLHRGHGVVVHPRTVIGDRVRFFHNVTIGRSDPHIPEELSTLGGFVIEDDVWLCAGAVILGATDTVRVGRGTIVAANSVLRQSTGSFEIWGGIPARKIADRDPSLPRA